MIDSNMAIIGVGERIQVAREDDGSLSTNVPNGIAFSPRSELDGRNRHRHFAVAPLAALIAENLTLRRGMANGVGGSIKNEGTVQLINILITQNAAGHGGAIYNEGILHAYLARYAHLLLFKSWRRLLCGRLQRDARQGVLLWWRAVCRTRRPHVFAWLCF